MQLQTRGFSGQGCACCFYCPTGQSARSMSHPPPDWGETLQNQLTSPLTGGGRSSLKMIFCICGVCFFVAYLAMKDVLGGVFLVLHVPDQSHSVGLVWSILIIVIGGHQQLRILWGKMAAVLYLGLIFNRSNSANAGLTHCHRPEVTSPDR